MNFVEVIITAEEPLREILLAEFTNLPYDTFEETETGFKAYTSEGHFDPEEIRKLISQYESLGASQFETKIIKKINWNEEWEKNFQPIQVENKILVRAEFHEPDKQLPYEIVITPKMSFGTGHHDTTFQMLQMQLNTDHVRKTVLDAGTGTGILAILAHKLGASKIYANDTDEWCVDNSKENFALNNCSQIETKLGDISIFKGLRADIILANINKNVLLQEMSTYFQILEKQGILLLSGFYEEDIPDLVSIAEGLGLEKKAESTKNNWSALKFIKG